MSEHQSTDAVRKSIIVQRDVAHVFAVWTEQIGAWWPAGHSVSRNRDTQVCLACKPGGRFYERTPEGKIYNWGQVERWEPPHHLVLSWYMGSGQAQPSRVHVQFIALDAHTTRVEITHRGPELIGDLWASRQTIFNGSWERILAALAAFLEISA